MLICGLILLFFVVLVDAGHPLWEFSTKIKRAVPFDLNQEITTTWPAGSVIYCWESQEARDLLRYHFLQALNLWYAAGLPEERFQFHEVPIEDCIRDRRNTLIIYHQPGSLEFSTTVGKYVGPNSELLPGPIAYFNDQRDPNGKKIGTNTLPEKIAHEIGHIYGLYHEHQAPFFWRGSPVFKVNCQNIEGFDECTARLTFDQIWGENGVCHNRHAALEADCVHIAQSLPINELYHYIPHPERGRDRAPQYEDVDWNSIMLYHSYVATKRDQAEVTQITLRKVQGGTNGMNFRINIKRAPSQGDVQALIQLYDASAQRRLSRLYHDPRSEYHTAFQNLQNFQVCDWPQPGPSGG
ncbi:uncharacterized protein KD926_008886 [Aspergillus affinis]|uniref:uncharacterized protein n=1 Tax=Aspergillus affinis TaxID=1070780 RepID=UPI0022FEDD46|nr:uncharacterized protein KD926_008886 [Aspergillus affinis]KAI9045459.1 hypothetical protein KD926_008886 [Aspergillus affinis]